MTPRRLSTQPSDRAQARGRLRIGKKYLEVADLLASESGESVNVCIGVAVLAGIAAADALCGVALAERYSGTDHRAAATLLTRVDANLGKRLDRLVRLKSESQYGDGLLSEHDRTIALREAAALIEAAEQRMLA